MAKGVGRAGVGRGCQHRHFLAHTVQQGHHVGLAVNQRCLTHVQQHVEQRELHLPQRLQATLEVLGGQHLVVQAAGQGLARVHMGGHVFQHIPFPAEVFHELAGQFHRIPFHATDARHIALVDLC